MSPSLYKKKHSRNLISNLISRWYGEGNVYSVDAVYVAWHLSILKVLSSFSFFFHSQPSLVNLYPVCPVRCVQLSPTHYLLLAIPQPAPAGLANNRPRCWASQFASRAASQLSLSPTRASQFNAVGVATSLRCKVNSAAASRGHFSSPLPIAMYYILYLASTYCTSRANGAMKLDRTGQATSIGTHNCNCHAGQPSSASPAQSSPEKTHANHRQASAAAAVGQNRLMRPLSPHLAIRALSASTTANIKQT